MEQVVSIGLNSFIRLKKLRVEHLNLDSTEAEKKVTSFDLNKDEIYKQFLSQLSENQTISFIKIERVFVDDNPRWLMLL